MSASTPRFSPLKGYTFPFGPLRLNVPKGQFSNNFNNALTKRGSNSFISLSLPQEGVVFLCTLSFLKRVSKPDNESKR